jgi:hypothetical protein
LWVIESYIGRIRLNKLRSRCTKAAARTSGIDLAITANGSIRAKGPAAAVAKWAPILAANKPAIVEELSRLEPVHVADWEERAAHLEYDAGIPRIWAVPFAKMLSSGPPRDFDPVRWQRVVDAALIFADKWAAEACRLGWTAEDIFGLHSFAPAARNDCKGIAWLLNRGHVVAIDAAGADILTVGGAKRRFYRKVITLGVDEAPG